MGTSEVAIAAIALAGTAIGGVIWLAKYFAKELSKDLREHTKAAVNQTVASKDAAKASREQTVASKEVLTFMKALNGKLAKATIQTVQEQHVEHQHVEHEIIDGKSIM